MRRFVIAITLGFLLGWSATHALFLQWWTLLPWGLAGVGLGHRATRTSAVIAGALYGFVLCFVFTLAGYGGTAPVITRVPFFTVVGVVGAVCGLVLALLGSGLASPVPKGPPTRDDAA